MERSYLMLKPGFTSKNIQDDLKAIIKIAKGKIIAEKEMVLTRELVREHYSHLLQLEHYPFIEDYMVSDKVIGYVVEGPDGIILKLRELIGPTKASTLRETDEKIAKTFRGKYAKTTTENVVHASDNDVNENGIKNAEIEINRFFKEL